MNTAQFRRERDYGAGIAIAGNLLRRELITSAEYRKVKAALIGKYSPVICSMQSNSPRSG